MKLADVQNPSTLYTPIVASVAVLQRLTEPQAERITSLIDNFTDVGFVQLRTDSWMKDSILFDLYDRDPKLSGNARCILSGLIEADGSSHT